MVASQEFVVSPTSKLSPTNSDRDPEITEVLIRSMSHPSQLQSTTDMCSSSSMSSPENQPAAIEININFHDDQNCTGCSKHSCTGSMAVCSQNDMPAREDPKEAKGEAKLLSLPSLRTEFIECDANGELKWKEVEVPSDLACSSPNTICKFSSPFQFCLHFCFVILFFLFSYLSLFFFMAFWCNKRTNSLSFCQLKNWHFLFGVCIFCLFCIIKLSRSKYLLPKRIMLERKFLCVN